MQTAAHAGEAADPERLEERQLCGLTRRGIPEADPQVGEFGPVRRHPVPAYRAGTRRYRGLPHGQSERLRVPGHAKDAAPRGFERAPVRQREPEVSPRQQELPPVRDPVFGRLPEEQAVEQIDPAVPARGAVPGTAGKGFRRQYQGKGLLDQLSRGFRPEGPARKRGRGGPEQ